MNVAFTLYNTVFLHPFKYISSVSYDRFTASSKASSSQSAIWCFLFQIPVSVLFLEVIL